MIKVVNKFKSFEESERANRRYYAGLTPQQRLDILFDSIAAHRDEQNEAAKGLREFIGLLNSEGVKYVVVGGYAVAFHGRPRFTDHMDFFVEPSGENSQKMENAVRRFGFSGTGLRAAGFQRPDSIIQLGLPPNRIDLLTAIDAVEFQEAWENRIEAEIDGAPINFISKNLLLKNKAATGRAQDKADIEEMSGDEP